MSSRPTFLRVDDTVAAPQGDIDPTTYRSIMSAFPTGVTVITTCERDGSRRGFTSNAVASVSLEPPLLVVCVAKTSETLPALRRARRFAVNFLKSGEQEISARFARKGDDKFEGLSCGTSSGLPILHEHCTAYVTCTTELEVEAGDHIMVVGRVLDGETAAEGIEPLLYHKGAFPAWPASG